VTDELRDALVDLREDQALALVDSLLTGGTDPTDVLADCQHAMDVIGDRFARGEAFIPELMMAGEIMQAIANKLRPYLEEAVAKQSLGTVVLGSAAGDIHDIGKNIVGMMLDIAGFDVVNLGVDVPAAEFVVAAQESNAGIIAVSCLLTSAFEAMRETVAAVDKANLRPAVRVMIGGAPVNDTICEYTEADGWGKDAVEAVELAKMWIGGA
jgi:5-methyltetrahydrofolate--homocysteine methyltransferase